MNTVVDKVFVEFRELAALPCGVKHVSRDRTDILLMYIGKEQMSGKDIHL